MKQVLLVLLLLFIGGIGLARGQDTSQHPPITIQNAGQVHELALLGEGRITGTAWSANAHTMVVGTSLDLYIYTRGQPAPYMLDVGGLSYLVLSDDGRFLAGLQFGHIVRLRAWDLVTNEEIILPEAESSPHPIRFLPDSPFLLGKTLDELKVWDLTTGQVIRNVPSRFPGLLDMSPDMQHIIGFWKLTQQGSGREYMTVLVLDGNTGEQISNTMSAEGPEIIQQVFHPIQNTILAVLHRNGVVRLWDTERNQLLYALTLPYDLVSSIAFSRDGQLLATGGTDGKIRLWEAATGALLEVLPDQPADVQAINFNADNQIIAFYQDSQAAYAWDAHTKETLIEVAFPEETTPVLHRVSFNAADDQIIAVGGDGTVRFWDVSTGEEQGVWSGSLHADEWSRLAMDFIGRNAVFSQDRTHLAILDQQTGELFLWRFDAGTDPVTMQTPVEYFGCNLAFSGDHRWLIFGGQRPGLWLWEFDRAMNLVHESLLVPNYISWLPDTDAFSPTEPLVSYLLNDPAQRVAGLYLHNIETGEIRVVTKVEQITSALVFSSDGSLLALRQLESLRLWDVHTGTLETEFEVCRDVGSIVFSPDGSLISVMCRYDVELYDAWSGEKLNTLIGHTSQIESVAFNVDGTLIVTAGADGTVRLWGVE